MTKPASVASVAVTLRTTAEAPVAGTPPCPAIATPVTAAVGLELSPAYPTESKARAGVTGTSAARRSAVSAGR